MSQNLSSVAVVIGALRVTDQLTIHQSNCLVSPFYNDWIEHSKDQLGRCLDMETHLKEQNFKHFEWSYKYVKNIVKIS